MPPGVRVLCRRATGQGPLPLKTALHPIAAASTARLLSIETIRPHINTGAAREVGGEVAVQYVARTIMDDTHRNHGQTAAAEDADYNRVPLQARI